jgi:O-antigen/teichoic acid export membrane protein
MALEKQVEINIIEASLNTLRLLGSVVVIVWVSQSIIAFLLWQTGIVILQVFVYYRLTWQVVPKSQSPPVFQLDILRQTWKYTAHISGTSIVVILLMQTDKILLSKLLPLEHFGYYMLASTLASQLFQVFSPFINALSPRLTALVAQNDQKELARVFHQGSLFVSAITTPPAAALIFFAPLILELWTHSAKVAEYSAAPLSLLVLGTLMNGMMSVPYQLQLAIGKPEIMLIVNIGFVLVMIPAMFSIVPHWGMTGAALIWAVLNTSYYLFISRITHWYVLRHEYLHWLFYDTFIPFMISITIMFGARLLTIIFPFPRHFLDITMLLVGIFLCYISQIALYNNLMKLRVRKVTY